MSSLTPDLALAYVRELSADLRAGIVLADARAPLAGDLALRGPAVALLAAHPHADELHGTAGSGAQVFAARAGRRAIVVVTGAHALASVVRRDLRTALSAMVGQTVQEPPSARPAPALIEALTTAAADAFRP